MRKGGRRASAFPFLSILSWPHPSLLAWRLAVWVEGVGDDLGRLAAGGGVTGAVVEMVQDLHLARAFVDVYPVAGVATDHPVEVDSLDVQPEWIAIGHVVEGLLGRGDIVGLARRGGVD